MKYLVLLPQGYDTSMRRYPVLYLLHGLTGDYKDWSTRTNLAEYSKTIPLIIVMPDAGNSWYTNAADGASKFEDYIATELPADVVQKYPDHQFEAWPRDRRIVDGWLRRAEAGAQATRAVLGGWQLQRGL